MDFPPLREPTSVITTGSAIMAVRYDGGILLSSDLSCSYGSGLHYTGVSHFRQLSPTVLLGGSGELADFQAIVRVISGRIEREATLTDGGVLSPAEVHNYIKRLQYNRRTKVNPWLITVVVAGFAADGSPYLGVTDPWGTSWEDGVITTGVAGRIKGVQLDAVVGKDKATVLAAANEVWKAIFARSMLVRGPLEFFDVTPSGITRLPEAKVAVNWKGIGVVYGESAVA
jgi:20S proteasome alpha/beta subunit